ncbi:TetR/AcrR family transcriptional regulator [Streptomyces violascens]|uniref:TetR/AcrR family transcriptional regulator n=1 Tax=Streptomyces violascens TaxID=67381 RepID=UPI0037B69D9A
MKKFENGSGDGSTDGSAPRGRPRSEAARRSVLDAALELCRRDGYQELTIKGIADEARVGRQTVYRWWPTKQDVLLEVLTELPHRSPAELFPDTGDVYRDVEELLGHTFRLTRGATGRAVVGLMADAQADASLARRLQEEVIAPRRAALREILERGVERGQLRQDGAVSLDLAVDFAFGVMWYRLLSGHAPVDEPLAAEIAAALGPLLGSAGGAGSPASKTARRH